MTTLTVSFDAGIPHARWGPLFHVFRLERPSVELDWRPVGFPVGGCELLDGADVGVFLNPPENAGLSELTLDASPMVVVMAAGHPLARLVELTVADVLEQPFPGGPSLDAQWSAFWTLDKQRGRPARRTGDDVRSAEDGLEVVAGGRAIATLPEWSAHGLSHPGVVALPLRDGPSVETRLVWRTGDARPSLQSLIALATAWTS